MRKMYVCGFMFDPEQRHVLLLRKSYPKDYKGEGRMPEMDGLLNGVGGLVKEGEAPVLVMVQKMKQELNVETVADEWTPFAEIQYDNCSRVIFMVCIARDGDQFAAAKTMTDEELVIGIVNGLHVLPVMPNLKWLVPMALDGAIMYGTIMDKSLNEAPFHTNEPVWHHYADAVVKNAGGDSAVPAENMEGVVSDGEIPTAPAEGNTVPMTHEERQDIAANGSEQAMP